MPVVCCQTVDKTLLSLRTEDRLILFSLQLSLSASFFLSNSFILFLPTPIGIYICGPFYNTYSTAQYLILKFLIKLISAPACYVLIGPRFQAISFML